jgi:hypothetical protein
MNEQIAKGTRNAHSRPKLEQVEQASNFARLDTVLHIEFAVDTLHLGTNRIDGDDQFSRDLRVGATGSQQAQDPLFVRAQWLDERRRGKSGCGRTVVPLRSLSVKGMQDGLEIPGQGLLAHIGDKRAQEGLHHRSFIQKETEITFGMACFKDRPKEFLCLLDVLMRCLCQDHDHPDFQGEARASHLMRGAQQAQKQVQGLFGLALCEESASDQRCTVGRSPLASWSMACMASTSRESRVSSGDLDGGMRVRRLVRRCRASVVCPCACSMRASTSAARTSTSSLERSLHGLRLQEGRHCRVSR